jgi:hypothetical protein
LSHTRLTHARLTLTLVVLLVLTAAAFGAWAFHRTPSRAGAATGTVAYSFTAWGDTRPGSQALHATYSAGWQHVRDKMATQPHAFEVVVGDLVNVATTDTAATVDAKYADFFSSLGASRSIARSYAVGNHEAVGTSAAGAAGWEKNIHPAHYDAFMHGAGTAADPRVIVLNLSTYETAHLGTIGYAGEGSTANTAQGDWLVSQLRVHEHDPNTFIVVNMHHPIADPKPGEGYDTHPAERQALEALFARYGVDLVLAGHVHAYVRHVMPDGTTYLMQGMGGAEAKDEMYAAHTSPGTDAARIGSVDSTHEQFGFTRFQVTTAGHLTAETFVTSETDWAWRVGDSFEVAQQAPQDASPPPSPKPSPPTTPTASPTPTATPSPRPSFELISQSRPASASSHKSAGRYANDGRATTRWTASSRSFPQWWRVDLGRVRTVSRVKVRFFDPASSPRKYAWGVQRSNDGRTWKKWTAGDRARYIRVLVKRLRSGSGRASIVEARVFTPAR